MVLSVPKLWQALETLIMLFWWSPSALVGGLSRLQCSLLASVL